MEKKKKNEDLVGVFSVQFLLVLERPHEVLHELQCHLEAK